ncbi:MAG: carbohydrate ABC transporter substrate-binding protein [Ruminococcus sp.]|jgi:raffinose/stachyose/melibiose transport system substrate-binding protein|uniref:Carbohydrate ABC transporter substrate-binding protein n=1 Tax=Schaedlerella arabinosiphila TaxID=2044587 RepID=A0A3R8JNX3_9FIRM|nr:ABC transporter substrate-binding protein [Schaedlerella arabinosiphila]MCI8723203.1 carbohydrate ABC transporter substrate-binding protein [Ruminococcus sp.]RRK32660.1 carbohydrate ABC transporter substrate-binding protein [Schaedlerella arabinosiphila]
MRKGISLFLAGIVMLAGAVTLAGCGGQSPEGQERQAKDAGREQVSIALWSDQLTERYGPYLQETFPEVDFEFYVATNSTDFYAYKEEHGDLPDILTVRRFALSDVAAWKDSLMDLSGSELAGAFHPSYLRSYTYSDGTVNWLPTWAEVDSILVNEKLLEAKGLGIPTNYREFLDLCETLKNMGIRPFLSNFGADYTCMEILQGFSIARLNSQEGREWRQRYESGQTDQLSEEVWMPVFERMRELIDCAGIGEADLKGDTASVFAAYGSHKAAMIRGTCGEAGRYEVEGESVMIPYPGDTKEDNWYLTYPAFQVAASARADENPKRKELILDVLEAMLDQDGQQHIAGGQDMITYSKGSEQKLSPMFSEMKSYVDDNRLYIRLASSDMFSISEMVIQGMITGKYPDAGSAFDAFNEAMRSEEEEVPAAVCIETEYPYAFQDDGGSPAASAVINSLREELDAQLLVGQSSNVAGNIYAGEYTQEELGFLTIGETVEILRCEMTGGQLYEYLDNVLAAEGKRGSVVNDSTLYVSSGFEMELRRTDQGYDLERLTLEGRELDRDRTYDLAVLGNEQLMHGDILAEAGASEYEKVELSFKQLIADRLTEGRQLAEPTDYIILH